MGNPVLNSAEHKLIHAREDAVYIFLTLDNMLLWFSIIIGTKAYTHDSRNTLVLIILQQYRKRVLLQYKLTHLYIIYIMVMGLY